MERTSIGGQARVDRDQVTRSSWARIGVCEISEVNVPSGFAYTVSVSVSSVPICTRSPVEAAFANAAASTEADPSSATDEPRRTRMHPGHS